MLSRNRHALKEGEAVCDRLARGEDVLLLRKGGLLEPRGGFRLDHREFFLFPTRYHGKGAPPPGRVDLSLYASVEEDLPVADLDALRRLQGMHAMDWEDVERRFHYGDEKGVHALVLRAWRLARPIAVEDAGAYDGCRSWVELREELPVETSGPVLGEDGFEAKRRAVREAIRG
ncbi:MAG TPA: DUF1802 family protein [Planctomycetota bacterium]|nr:DUF1802 family protein [Planctomycetota bacterium]